MRYTAAMTMLDLGPERPGQASETRQMSDLDRTEVPARVSGKVFWPLLLVLIAGLVLFFALR